MTILLWPSHGSVITKFCCRFKHFIEFMLYIDTCTLRLIHGKMNLWLNFIFQVFLLLRRIYRYNELNSNLTSCCPSQLWGILAVFDSVVRCLLKKIIYTYIHVYNEIRLIRKIYIHLTKLPFIVKLLNTLCCTHFAIVPLNNVNFAGLECSVGTN